jgi:transposase
MKRIGRTGMGRAAYEPSMMVALVLFAYSTKERSSRGIERHCRQDIAYRVITANRVPDHATIARFVCRHEVALAELFGSVLGLCEKAGLVRSGVVAIDGTKMHANASRDSNVDCDRVAREIIAEAIATDEAEDEVHGDARGDELPGELSTEAGRREWLARELGRQRAEDGEENESGCEPDVDAGHEFDAGRIVARSRGRRGGCAKPSASSTSIVGAARRRSRGRGLSGCWRRVGALRMSSPLSAAGTRRMTVIARAGATSTAGGSALHRSRITRRRRRRGRST